MFSRKHSTPISPKPFVARFKEFLRENETPAFAYETLRHTVGGKNPTPPGVYKTLSIMGKTTYQLVHDFSH